MKKEFLRSKHKSKIKGFTLIELLVVIAIIGILSSVVIASLNSAREKGKISMIKSTLNNIQTQAEITYTETGSYASLYNASTYDCIGPLANMAENLADQGITVKCYSRNNLPQEDVYLRFGSTAIIYDISNFKAWSVDQNGVVTWDQRGVNSSGNYVTPDVYSGMSWSVSSSACAKAGGRLPSIEQLFTLASAYYTASGNTSYNVPSFVVDYYWSSTITPSDASRAYMLTFSYGGINSDSVASGWYARCVR